MRKFAIFTATVLLAAVCLAAIESPRANTLPTFQPVQQQGDLKVTLLQVSRVTTFSNQFVGKLPDDHVRAIPGVEVIYQIERTGTAPLGELNVGGIKCFVGGAPARQISDLVGGGAGVVEPWSDKDQSTGFDLPAVASAKRARIQRAYLRGVVIDSNHIDIRIEAGFDKLQPFIFQSVPLAPDGG